MKTGIEFYFFKTWLLVVAIALAVTSLSKNPKLLIYMVPSVIQVKPNTTLNNVQHQIKLNAKHSSYNLDKMQQIQKKIDDEDLVVYIPDEDRANLIKLIRKGK